MQQCSDKTNAQVFGYFGYKKSIEKFQVYQNKTAKNVNILPIKYALVKS